MSASLTTISLGMELDPTLPRERSLLSFVQTRGAISSQRKIEQAAQDFESILLNQWLQQAREAFAGVPGGSEDDERDPGESQLQEIGMQSLATAITKSGGIGIASLITHQLNSQRSEEHPGDVQAERLVPTHIAPRDLPRHSFQKITPK